MLFLFSTTELLDPGPVSRLLKRTFGFLRNEMTGCLRTLHNEELQDHQSKEGEMARTYFAHARVKKFVENSDQNT